jgi:hypothetical protein
MNLTLGEILNTNIPVGELEIESDQGIWKFNKIVIEAKDQLK